jgi:hypothetical protein
MVMRTIKQRSLLPKLCSLGQDPQAWISALAVVTLLGLGSGVLESADRPAPQLTQSQAGAAADEQLASLDASKL